MWATPSYIGEIFWDDYKIVFQLISFCRVCKIALYFVEKLDKVWNTYPCDLHNIQPFFVTM